MPISRKKLRFNTVSLDIGCGNCRKLKISQLLYPKSEPGNPINRKLQLGNNHSSSSSWDNEGTAATFSPYGSSSERLSSGGENNRKAVRGLGRVGGEGVAVEKDSDDPYLDFRQSMLQMIMENEIYSEDDLRELLRWFLLLNSPYHHEVIVKAFTEIWNGVHSVKPTNSSKIHLSHKSRDP